MRIKVIHNEEACEAALRDLEILIDANPLPGTTKFEELELVALVIKDYEDKRYPMNPPDPIEAIRFRLEQQGQTRKHLEQSLGSRHRVSEILNRKRPLSLSMIRALHRQLGIPAEVLIAETTQVRDARGTSRKPNKKSRLKTTT